MISREKIISILNLRLFASIDTYLDLYDLAYF